MGHAPKGRGARAQAAAAAAVVATVAANINYYLGTLVGPSRIRKS
jgi:membrane protein DedA with SNARE-associated domain